MILLDVIGGEWAFLSWGFMLLPFICLIAAVAIGIIITVKVVRKTRSEDEKASAVDIATPVSTELEDDK